MRRDLIVGVGMVAALMSRGLAAGAAEDPTVRLMLDHLADQHAPTASVAQGPAWNAATVRRLALWVRGDRAAATDEDLALLRSEVERPAALVVAGAVSLGNYQGGFLYYYLRHLQAARRLAERAGSLQGAVWTPAVDGDSPLGLITGASSGSINAFVAAMASCQSPVLDPRKSLFWNVWYPVGRDALVQDEGVAPDGLLSTKPIADATQRLRAAWNGGAWSASGSCAVRVGLSATRMRPRTIRPYDGADLELQKQSEKLMFEMRGGPGEVPRLAPITPDPEAPGDGLFQKLFPRVGQPNRPVGIDDVLDILRASSAFSIAFPPHALTLTTGDTHEADPGTFTDGGVFDDLPVGMAVLMQRWHLGETGALESRYIIQNPDFIAWRPTSAARTDAPASAPSFLTTWLPFVGDFLNTAFQVELTDTIERERALYTGLEVPPRRMPVAGAYLLEFLAFAERDFRAFDFFSGMVDAWQQLAETSLAFHVLAAAEQPIQLENAPEFDCLLAHRTRPLASAGPPMDDACKDVGGAADPVLRTNIEALIGASVATRAWSERTDPKPGDRSDEAVFMRALGGNASTPAYQFRELLYRGAPATAATLPLAIRDTLQDIIERTTFNQADGLGRFVVGGVGKAMANFYAYRAPSVFAGAAMVSDRGVEVQGAKRLPWDHGAPALVDLRVDAAVRVVGIHNAALDEAPERQNVLAFTYMAAAHLTNEFQFGRLCRSLQDLQSIVQFHLGLGWAVQSLQTWNGPLLWRHGPEALLGVSVLQRLYFEASTNIFLDNCAGNNQCGHAEPYLSPRTPPVVDASWGLRFALGYRFFLD